MPTNWANTSFGFGNYASTINGGTNLLGTETPANQYARLCENSGAVRVMGGEKV
jgi:hypothetical protein